jgi:3-hydroxy-9,10-secoandrosta-1,3,5(10)-triene-9,17-dione monooxygenase
MSAVAVDAPSKQDLVERAEALKPLLSRNAAEAEETRRIPDETIAAVKEAGLFKLMTPRRFGGYEVPFDTKLAVSAKLAEACGSTAWVVTLTNVCGWMVGLSCDQAQQDIWGANPDARVCGVLAPTSQTRREGAGLRVTGRWGYASGSLHSDWAVLGVPVVDEAGEPVDQGLALIPMSDLAIEDTWFVAGMKGTGSNTLVAQDVFVPDHRIVSVPAAINNQYPTEHTGEAVYRSSFIPALALVLAGPQVGMARAAVDLVIEKAPKRQIAYTIFTRQTDSPAFQLQVSDAAMLADTALLHVERAARDIDETAARGEVMDYVARARVRADTGWAIRKAREAIDTAISANGASSFADVSPLQRLWRDANTAGRHAVVLPSVNQEVYGKALLGIAYEDNITPLI